MIRKYFKPSLNPTVFAVICVLGLTNVHAVGPENAIRERIKDRLPEVVELKIEGVLVEGADGYLKVAPNQPASGSILRLMQMENVDRKEIYRIIGLKSTPLLSADEVGKRRAQIIKNK